MKRSAIYFFGLLALIYGAWTILYPTSRVRAKISIDVETPEGLKTGSSVQEVIYSLEPCPLCNHSGPKFRRIVIGQAVIVDLGQRGHLFGLLYRGDERGIDSSGPLTPVVISRLLGPKDWRGAETVRALGRVSGKADVPAELMPFMVRFRDINDPKTVEHVIPNNLAASFGPGVKLVKATIEITDDQVTAGIEKKLTWLDLLTTGSITGITSWNPEKPEPTNYLPAVAFRQGMRK